MPLVLRLPDGAGRGSRIRGAVAQVDIAPTLLDLVGLPATGMDGTSLRSSLGSGMVAGRTIYSETLYPRYHFGWSELYAASDGRFQFIRAPHRELYDLNRDVAQRENLASERAQTAVSMEAWLSRMTSAVAAPEAADAQTRERLAALGYVGTASAPLANATDLPDPKDKIGAYEDLRKGLALRASGLNQEAVPQLRKVVSENPLMIDAWESLGLSLISLGQEKAGIEAMERAIKIDPLRAEPHMALAKLHALGGNMSVAVAHAEIAARKEPGRSFEILAQIMMDKRKEKRRSPSPDEAWPPIRNAA